MYWLAGAVALSAIASAISNNIASERNIHFTRSNNRTAMLMGLLNMMREDNATQRRVADLRASGLSPTLAAGSPAASNVSVKTEAPTASPPLAGVEDTALKMMQAMAMSTQMAQTEQQTAYLQQQMKQKEKLFPAELRRIEATINNMNSTAYERNYNVEQAKKAGLATKNTSALGKLFQDLVGGENSTPANSFKRRYENIKKSFDKEIEFQKSEQKTKETFQNFDKNKKYPLINRGYVPNFSK